MRNVPAFLVLALSLALAATACTTFPELDGHTVTETGEKPRLVPLELLLASVPTHGATPDAADALTARAAALRARAAALQRQGALAPATQSGTPTAVTPPG